MKYALSIFEHQFAREPQPAELYWDELIELFDSFKEGDFDKTRQKHFNGVKFKEGGQRNNDGVDSIHILVLDYDDGMSIKAAKDHFEDYQHIGYTSYNHQFDKHGDGHVVDKFRLLLPLSKPCPFENWIEIRDYLSTFAPHVDHVSTRPHQPYAVPIARPNAPNEIWTNDGKTVDWTTWEKKEQGQFGNADPSLRSPYNLHLDDVIQTKSGSIRIGDVTQTINHVYCPFHNDKSPGAYLSKSPNGNIFLHCRSKCGTTFVERNQEDREDNIIKQFVKEKTKKKKQSYRQRKIEQYKKEKEYKEQLEEGDDALANCVSLDDLLEFADEYEPYPWHKREEMLRKQYKLSEERILLYAAEGFGKSSIAKILINEKKKKVVFACKSNVQAEEQANSFRDKYGLKVQLICARDHWLRTIEKVDVEYYEARHPWDAERVNEVKTKLAMRKVGMDRQKIQHLWDIYEPPKPDFQNHDMVVTTQARVMGWGRRQHTHQLPRRPDPKGKVSPVVIIPDDKRIVPKSATIICDDGQMEDFCMLADFDNKYLKTRRSTSESLIELYGEEYEALPQVDGRSLKRKTVGEHEYFVRPKSFLFGFGFIGNQIIFSTTEHLTRELIFRRYGGKKEKFVQENGERKTVGKVYEPALIPDHHMKMNAGKITCFKTKNVQKKRDGILPAIAERVRAIWDNDIEYIADGQGCALNHVTIKGQNTYSSHDLIVEISYAHMFKVTKLLHELEWDEVGEKDGRFLQVILALDTIHQAIGRNSGYRYADKPTEERGESVVLIEPQLFNNVLKHIRYKVSYTVDVDNVKTRFNRSKIGQCFPTTVGWYIKNISQFLQMQGGRTFMGDVKRSFKQVGTNPRHPSVRQHRLLDSLNTILKDIEESIKDIRGDKNAEAKYIEKGVAEQNKYAEFVTDIIDQVEAIDLIPRLQSNQLSIQSSEDGINIEKTA